MTEIHHSEWCCQEPACTVAGCGGCNCGAAEKSAARDRRSETAAFWIVGTSLIVGCVAYLVGLSTSGIVSNSALVVQVACGLAFLGALWRARRRNLGSRRERRGAAR